MSGMYKGTSKYQDGRYMNKEKKLISERDWPKHFDEKINIENIGIISKTLYACHSNI